MSRDLFCAAPFLDHKEADGKDDNNDHHTVKDQCSYIPLIVRLPNSGRQLCSEAGHRMQSAPRTNIALHWKEGGALLAAKCRPFVDAAWSATLLKTAGGGQHKGQPPSNSDVSKTDIVSGALRPIITCMQCVSHVIIVCIHN